MNLPMEYNNGTLTFTHIQAMTSLISIISTHFLIRSFTLVSDLEITSILNFQKMASNHFFEIKFVNSVENNDTGRSGERGYIILQQTGYNLLKIMKDQPKLILTILITDQANPSPSEFFPNLIIPSSTSFFVVFLPKQPARFLSSENSTPVRGKFFRLYKPTSNFTTRTFPLMSYKGVHATKWYWLDKRTHWNSYAKDIMNMSEITVTIALATPRERNIAVTNFLRNKNSFFWRTMAEFLKFRIEIHVENISPQNVKSVTSVYLKLLMTVADGLGVLPVMSSERNHPSLGFIVTGLDSKYQLLVKAPQYVHSWQSTLKPFTLESWLCLGLTILLISFILKIVTFGKQEVNASCCFLMVFGFICSQGCPNIPKDMSARFVCYTALLFSIIIYQFYTSNFCSLLSTKEVSLPFTSLEQLIAKRTHALYIHPDTAIYAHILKAESGIFKKLYDEILKKDPLHQLKSTNRVKAFDKVCKNTGAILGLPFQIVYMNELTCPTIPVNSGFFPTSIATAIRKTFPFQFQFKFVHLRLLEAGLTHKFKNDFFNFNQQRPTKAVVTNEPVSLNHVALLFALYGMFIVLSLMAFCFEIFISRALKRQNKHSSDGKLFLRREQDLFEYP